MVGAASQKSGKRRTQRISRGGGLESCPAAERRCRQIKGSAGFGPKPGEETSGKGGRSAAGETSQAANFHHRFRPAAFRHVADDANAEGGRLRGNDGSSAHCR